VKSRASASALTHSHTHFRSDTLVLFPRLDNAPCAGGDTRLPLLIEPPTRVGIHCHGAGEGRQRDWQHMEGGSRTLRLLTGTATTAKSGDSGSEERAQGVDGVDGVGLAGGRTRFTSPFAPR
jgi:hypothetical protein